MKKYFPVLLSKKGELVALHHLTQNVKDDISPIIQVLRGSIEKQILDKEKQPTGEVEYIGNLENNLSTHWSFFGNQVFVDFSLFDNIGSQIGFIKTLFGNLFKAGVNIVPVIQQNSDAVYFEAVKECIQKHACKICIRVSNGSGGWLDYNKNMNAVVSKLKTSPSNVALLLDLGQVGEHDYNTLAAVAGFALQTLTVPIKEWSDVVIVSSSFPENLTNIPSVDEGHRIKRYEWYAWNTLKQPGSLKGIKYGDYGTKSAIFTDANFRGTVSLKYTAEKEFLIFRGKKTEDHADGHGQYITHAKNLVKCDEYSGRDFSWGDLKYYEISQQTVSDDSRKTGNATSWVQYSQNHHIALLHSLL